MYVCHPYIRWHTYIRTLSVCYTYVSSGVRMYVLHVYARICTYICQQILIRAYTFVYVHTFIYGYTCNTCIYMQIRAYVHIRTYMHIRAIHAYTCIYMNTCIYVNWKLIRAIYVHIWLVYARICTYIARICFCFTYFCLRGEGGAACQQRETDPCNEHTKRYPKQCKTPLTFSGLEPRLPSQRG